MSTTKEDDKRAGRNPVNKKKYGPSTTQKQRSAETTSSSSSSRRRIVSESSSSFWETIITGPDWFLKYTLPLVLLFLLQNYNPRHIILQTQWSPTIIPSQIHQQLPLWVQSYFRNTTIHAAANGGPNYNERQVLVVGTMSSGTRQTAEYSLGGGDIFGYEIGHELSDAETQFVRDGTVSWIFGIRFLPKPSKENGGIQKAITNLCKDGIKAIGFHPRMYRGGVCPDNSDQQWNLCWARECALLLSEEWGCAFNREGGGCTFQPHKRTLHQTRHPLRLVESLMAKYCDNAVPRYRDAFTKLVHSLFGDSLIIGDGDGDDDDSSNELTCLEMTSRFVLYYNLALIKAREQHGLIHAMYPVETTTPCQIAKLAGFDDFNTVVYKPNLLRYQRACATTAAGSNTANDPSSLLLLPGHQILKPKKKYKVNHGKTRIQLSWKDFEGGQNDSKRPVGDMSLVNEMKELTKLLGYTVEEDQEENQEKEEIPKR